MPGSRNNEVNSSLISPDLFFSSPTINSKTDIYGLGSVIYSLMNMEREQTLWEQGSDQVLVKFINQMSPFKQHAPNPHYSPKLTKLVASMLSLSNQQRPDCGTPGLTRIASVLDEGNSDA